MARRVAAAFAAGCLAASALGLSAFAATPMDMSAPVPWAKTGATPLVQLDAHKRPTLIALVIPGGFLAKLPKQRSEAVYPMPSAGLVQTANLQWHPSGHEPEHVYDTPHIDVHFYTITEAVRQTIVPNAPAGKVMPPKKILPPNSLLAPGFVPGMGMHDILKSAPEFNGKPFTVSPIIGYWNGDLAFFEVMFTKKWLATKHGAAGAFPQPATVKQHGSYPTKYSVSYDKATDSYRIALTDFIQR